MASDELVGDVVDRRAVTAKPQLVVGVLETQDPANRALLVRPFDRPKKNNVDQPMVQPITVKSDYA